MNTSAVERSEANSSDAPDEVSIAGDVVTLRSRRGLLALERATIDDFVLNAIAGCLQIRSGVVSGWILTRSPISRIRFHIDGKLVGDAVPTMFRPDVATAFPEWPGPGPVGFSIALRGAELPTSVPPEILVVAHTADGQELRLTRTLALQVSPQAQKQAAPVARVNVEVADLTVDGMLVVSGWVAAMEPLIAVQVFVGEHRVGVAEAGRQRDDVAAAFPDYSHAAAGGFALTRRLAVDRLDEPATVRVECLLRSGRSHEATVPLRQQQSAPPPAALSLRTFHQEAAPAAVAAAPANRVASHIDEALLTTSGALKLHGWAFSPDGLASIKVVLNGDVVGTVNAGRPRIDVGRLHPAVPAAANSGFLFETQLGGEFAGEHRLSVILTDGTGQSREENLILQALTAAVVAAVAEAAGNEFIKLEVEEPGQRNGKALQPIRGATTISGWALARQGIERIEVEIDGVPAGTAYYGRGRHDVEGAFPDWPNALFSGYALSIPAKVLANGTRTFLIRATDKAGEVVENRFTAEVDKTEVEAGPQLLRAAMSYMERRTGQRVLEAAGYEPVFRLLLLGEAGKAGLDRVATTLESLYAQAWPHWQVGIVAPGKGRARKYRDALLKRCALAPDRIAVVNAGDVTDLASFASHGFGARRPEGRKAPAAALFGLLRAGDQLGLDAMLAAALANSHADRAELLYADDRRYSATLQAEAAFFKPDWSPDLLLSQNYFGRAWFATPALLAKVRATAAELLRQGEYDLVLRLAEAAGTVKHVPQVLLRAAAAGDTAAQEGAALVAMQQRRGLSGAVEATGTAGVWRVRRDVVRPGLVSIIMPSIAARGHVKLCLESIRDMTHYRNFEIILIDNIRGDDLTEEQIGWKAFFHEHADIVVPVDEGFNWSRFNNIGASHAKGEYLLFLNDDIQVLDPYWLEALLEHAQRDDVGVVGPLLLYPDMRVQHAGMFLSRSKLGLARHAFRFAQDADPGYFALCAGQRNVIAVTGACLMSRREVYDQLGGFDEMHSVINNDLDYCLRSHRAGLLCVYTPHTRLIHHELASRARMREDFDLSGFLAAWREQFLEGDPYFNPNLSTDFDDYATELEPVVQLIAGYPIGDAATVRHILIVKLDHIGDFVVSMPAVRRLKEIFPAARITMMLGKAAATLARYEPAIDQVIEFEFFEARSGSGYKTVTEEDYARLTARLAAEKFDLAIDLRKHGDTRHFLQHSGATWLGGFNRDARFPWLDVAIEWEADPVAAPKRNHVAADLVNLVNAVGSAFEADRRTLRAPASGHIAMLPEALEQEFVGLFSGAFACIHPAAGNDIKQWPIEYFAILADMLIERDGMKVAIIGGPDEKEMALTLVSKMRNKDAIFDLVGRCRLHELPEIMLRASLFIGNDSGPKHIASGLGVPTVGVHSGIVPVEEWGPLGPDAVAMRRDVTCAPCYRGKVQECHRELACLTAIRPSQVHERCRHLLALGAARGRPPAEQPGEPATPPA